MSNFAFESKVFEAADISAVFVLFGLMVLITQIILCFHVEACNEVTTHWATHTHMVLSLYLERRLGSSAVRLISFSRGIQVKPSNGTVFLAAGQGDDLVLRDTDLFFHLHLAPPSLLHCKKKEEEKIQLTFPLFFLLLLGQNSQTQDMKGDAPVCTLTHIHLKVTRTRDNWDQFPVSVVTNFRQTISQIRSN